MLTLEHRRKCLCPCDELRPGLGLEIESDYSACLSPRAIDSATRECCAGSDLSRSHHVLVRGSLTPSWSGEKVLGLGLGFWLGLGLGSGLGSRTASRYSCRRGMIYALGLENDAYVVLKLNHFATRVRFRFRLQHVLVLGPLTPPHCGAIVLFEMTADRVNGGGKYCCGGYGTLGSGLGLGLGSDYSACLNPRTIDSSTGWGYSAVWDNSRS
eukprot:1391982-Amorphochlora_amoeboformis.AAC.1